MECLSVKCILFILKIQIYLFVFLASKSGNLKFFNQTKKLQEIFNYTRENFFINEQITFIFRNLTTFYLVIYSVRPTRQVVVLIAASRFELKCTRGHPDLVWHISTLLFTNKMLRSEQVTKPRRMARNSTWTKQSFLENDVKHTKT